MKNLIGTFSGNLNNLGNTLHVQMTAQQTDLKNQADDLQRRLIEMSNDTEELQGEVVRLRDVTDERLTQIRRSLERHSRTIEQRLETMVQNQGLIQQNTLSTYRVLELLAWKQILFCYFIYELRWTTGKLWMIFNVVVGLLYRVVRQWIGWILHKLRWLAETGRLLGGQRARPRVVRFADWLDAFVQVERPFVIEVTAWALLAILFGSISVRVGLYGGQWFATDNTVQWATEYTGLYGRAYADPVASVMGGPSLVHSAGGNKWFASRHQSYDSNRVSVPAHEAMTAVTHTPPMGHDESNVPDEAEQSVVDKRGWWERYLKPTAAPAQATNGGDVREKAELKELVRLTTDAAEKVAKAVALSVKMNEAATKATTRVAEMAEVKEGMVRMMKSVKVLKNWLAKYLL